MKSKTKNSLCTSSGLRTVATCTNVTPNNSFQRTVRPPSDNHLLLTGCSSNTGENFDVPTPSQK